jgi:hypothetical protein
MSAHQFGTADGVANRSAERLRPARFFAFHPGWPSPARTI